MNSGINTAPVQNTPGGIGQLQINTFLSDVGKPAEGATVRVIDPDSGKIMEEVRTNAQGKAPQLSFSTPPLEFSMQSGLPRPFNQYNLTIAFPDYQEAVIENVQMYPQVTAVQNVSLKPQFPGILIPYPTLWGNFPPKIPEAPVKELPFPSNLVVLPEPVVPGLVVVHLGVPGNVSAGNVTVGFTDYIKNVASSEIYSTWPKETLKANILAIISFTLNRVYTEWYRGKGFDFTVTNSTAYDQAFTYGRTIFQEISDVVDEVFTTYITKPDIAQPLFTQYCDGDRVSCDGWLSQWGSKDLGDQGYPALQILKSFYGYEIVLKEAKKVEGIPISFPGYALDIGSTGSAVQTIQRQLNTISNNYPLIPKIAEDGVYGESTAKAVSVFQQTFDLPVTGRVNFPTWYRISDVFTAVSKLS
jgi:hypothetical protein